MELNPENSQILSRFENRVGEGKQPYYFVLKARNGKIIGVSENYPKTQNRDKGINSVNENGCTTRIKDQIKDVEIICLELVVNGRLIEWNKNSISFEELVILTFGNGNQNPNRCFTVTYSDGHISNPTGSLVKEKEVNVKPKMIFNVTATDKS